MAKCPGIGFFGLFGTRHQKPRALHVYRFFVNNPGGSLEYDIGPYTRISWVCDNCGERWTTDKKGTWKLEDFS